MNRKEWHEQRREVLTASPAYYYCNLFSSNKTIKEIISQNEDLAHEELCNLPVKMANNFASNKFNKTKYALYHEKTMDENRYFLFNHKISQSQSIKKGHKLEKGVIDNFREDLQKQGIEVANVDDKQRLVIKEDLKIGATCDAFFDIKTTSGKIVRAVLEAKTTAQFKQSDELKHIFQVIWQLKCTGLHLGFIHKYNHQTGEYLKWIVNSQQFEHFDLIYNEIDNVAKKAYEWLETVNPAELEPDPNNKNDRTIQEVLQMSDEEVEEALYDYEVLETADPELAELAEIVGKYNLTIADLKEQEKQAEEAKKKLKEKLTSIKHKNLLIQAPDGQKYKAKKIVVSPSYWTQEDIDKEIVKFQKGEPKKAGHISLKVEALDYQNV